ncbi:MAG: PaaI family thioesterase [Peptococcales bacterium]|jgi:uncharacterized protein (TIGR00369 family)
MFFREPKNNGIDCRLFGTIINANEECPYHDLLDMYIVELGLGEAVIEVPTQNEHLNPMGTVHGGVTFSLMDTVMGVAIRTLNCDSVTVEANINYVKPVQKSDILTATGKVVNLGKKIIVTEGIVKNRAGETIAVARGTYFNTGEYLAPSAFFTVEE